MSSSSPAGMRRNATCHTAAKTSPIMTTRRGNFALAKNSRIASRYAIPAIVKEARKYDSPLSSKLREHMTSAAHKMAPGAYILHAGVTLTILPCSNLIVQSAAPTLEAKPPCGAPLPEPNATPLPTEPGPQQCQCRKMDLQDQRKVLEFLLAIEAARAR